MRPTMRAAIYARVSTANNGQNPEMQLGELRDHCQRRGWQIVGEYVDLASLVPKSTDRARLKDRSQTSTNHAVHRRAPSRGPN